VALGECARFVSTSRTRSPAFGYNAGRMSLDLDSIPQADGTVADVPTTPPQTPPPTPKTPLTKLDLGPQGRETATDLYAWAYAKANARSRGAYPSVGPKPQR
jgi:hypothetical protein